MTTHYGFALLKLSIIKMKVIIMVYQNRSYEHEFRNQQGPSSILTSYRTLDTLFGFPLLQFIHQ